MASPEKLAPALPETLPENFNDWDSEASAASSSGGTGEWDAMYAVGGTQKPLAQSEYLDAILESFVDTPRVWRSDASAPVFVKPQNEFEKWEKEASPAPPSRNSNEQAPAAIRTDIPKPLKQSPEREATSSPAPDPQQDTPPASSEAVIAKLQNGFVNLEPEASPAPLPGDSGEWEVANILGEPSKPPAPSTEREIVLSPTLGNPRDAWPALSAPVFAKPQTPAIESIDGSPNQAAQKPVIGQVTSEGAVAPWSQVVNEDGAQDSPDSTGSLMREADRALSQLFSSETAEVKGKQKTPNNKRAIFVAVGASSILIPLILVFSFGHHGTKAATRQTVQPLPAATDTQMNADTPDPSADNSSTQNKPPAAEKQQKTDSQPARQQDEEDSAQPATEVQTQMMNDQLSAPTVIPRAEKKQVAENAPPPSSFATGGADALGGSGSVASVFNGRTQPIVKAVSVKPLAISSGVANGMLIQKSEPVYPPIARTARVSGTVELHATITRNGTIKDLQAVNGPLMLRQAAMEAVRNWRYKPYTLNNQPTDVETTINVVFTLTN